MREAAEADPRVGVAWAGPKATKAFGPASCGDAGPHASGLVASVLPRRLLGPGGLFTPATDAQNPGLEAHSEEEPSGHPLESSAQWRNQSFGGSAVGAADSVPGQGSSCQRVANPFTWLRAGSFLRQRSRRVGGNRAIPRQDRVAAAWAPWYPRAAMRDNIRLVSSAGTGYTYYTTKNKRTQTAKMAIKKYDPVVRKHVEFKEAKMPPHSK